MKKNLLLFSIATLFFIVGCNDDDDNNPDPISSGNVVNIIDDIEVPTTWYADSIYVISDPDFWVEASLTIQPGTVIKFSASGKYLTISSSGTVNASGTAEKPIIFTSVKDDEHGGDNNNDGITTQPAPGDWARVSCESNSNIFRYCKFYYGGGSTYKTTLQVVSENCEISNCLFVNNVGGKNGDFYYGSLDASDGGTNTIIKNNTFYNNIIPLSINSLIDLDNSNKFSNPSDANEINTMNGIFIYDLGGIAEPVSWHEDEVPFVINDNDLWIESGGSLTLSNNVILKFTATSVIIVAEGAAINNYSNCIFTSFKDDAKGGDTNGDSSATTPADGDWGGIYNDLASFYYSWPVIFYDSY